MMSKDKIWLPTGAGLLSALFVIIGATLIHNYWLPAMFPQPAVAWVFFCFFGGVSIVEIPFMVYALRKLAESDKPKTILTVQFGYGLFVFFAAVYALPNLILTDLRYLWMGFVLGSICLLRFIVSLIFL